MVLKLVLKFIVILSLINSIQCVCKGSQAIIDAINDLKSEFKSESKATQDAIGELSKRIKTLEEQINSSSPTPDPNKPSTCKLVQK